MYTYSPDEQKEISRRIGYDPLKWNPDDSTQVRELECLALKAMTSGKDKDGKDLSESDYNWLSLITGRM
jgi:hypothetical protein